MRARMDRGIRRLKRALRLFNAGLMTRNELAGIAYRERRVLDRIHRRLCKMEMKNG